MHSLVVTADQQQQQRRDEAENRNDTNNNSNDALQQPSPSYENAGVRSGGAVHIEAEAASATPRGGRLQNKMKKVGILKLD